MSINITRYNFHLANKWRFKNLVIPFVGKGMGKQAQSHIVGGECELVWDLWGKFGSFYSIKNTPSFQLSNSTYRTLSYGYNNKWIQWYASKDIYYIPIYYREKNGKNYKHPPTEDWLN